jgi:hypothetical protein
MRLDFLEFPSPGWSRSLPRQGAPPPAGVFLILWIRDGDEFSTSVEDAQAARASFGTSRASLAATMSIDKMLTLGGPAVTLATPLDPPKT